MEIVKINSEDDFLPAIQKAIAVLRLGGVIVYPTDTFYALGANAMEPQSVERVFRIKKREKEKPLPIAVRNIKWAKGLSFIYRKEEKLLNKIWPGPTTVVLPKRNVVPDVLTAAKPSVAMRIPNHRFVEKLLAKFGYPITSTSATVSGVSPSRNISDIIGLFERAEYQPSLVIDAGDLPESEPSTVIDLIGSQPKILRVGPSNPKKLMKLLEI